MNIGMEAVRHYAPKKPLGAGKCACGRTISGNKTACRDCVEQTVRGCGGGSIGILNVGAGDVKISFDSGNASETVRAGRIVKDMMRRGFVLLVEVERDGVRAYERATGFDEKKNEYIIADYDSLEAAKVDAADAAAVAEPATGLDDGPDIAAPTPKKGKKEKRLPMASTRATAVGRSSGG